MLAGSQQIAQKCRHVQPKLQKWIADSSENHPDSMGPSPFPRFLSSLSLTGCEQADRLLLINDLINNVIKRYEAFKAGDRSATAEIDPACVPTSSPSLTSSLTKGSGGQTRHGVSRR